MFQERYLQQGSLVTFIFCLLIIGVRAQADSGGCKIQAGSNPKITIEEFSDFECPYCAKGSETLNQIRKDYPHQVQMVFRNFPLPHHAYAQVAAEAFTAICQQNSTLADRFQKEVFDNQMKLKSQGEAFLYEVAKKVGVDVEKMKKDMKSDIVANTLIEDKKRAQEFGITGTPSFRIGTQTVVGARPYADMKKIVEQELKK